MSSNRCRTLLTLGFVGVGVLAAGCSTAHSSAARNNNVLILGSQHQRGLAVQADRVAQSVVAETGGPAIVIVPSDE